MVIPPPPPPPPPINALQQLMPGLANLGTAVPFSSSDGAAAQSKGKTSLAFVPPPMPKYDSGKDRNKAGKVEEKSQRENHAAKDEDLGGINPCADGDPRQRRSEFESKREWQDRIAAEVKVALRPFYQNKRINKEEYKTIMKKAVTKVRVVNFFIGCFCIV